MTEFVTITRTEREALQRLSMFKAYRVTRGWWAGQKLITLKTGKSLILKGLVSPLHGPTQSHLPLTRLGKDALSLIEQSARARK